MWGRPIGSPAFVADMKLPHTQPIHDPASLWKMQLILLAIAEAMFGPRDASYKLYQPQFYEDGPNLRFTPDQAGIFVEMSHNGRFYWPTVVYEMAHETVHLLNPGVLGTANNLEEGVAVAFSIYAQEYYDVKVQRPSPNNQDEVEYHIALSLVESLPDGALASAGRLRRQFGRLSAVMYEDLLELYPDLDHGLANLLASKFKR